MKTPPNTPPRHVSLARPKWCFPAPTAEDLAAEIRFDQLHKLADAIQVRRGWARWRCEEEAAAQMGRVPVTG